MYPAGGNHINYYIPIQDNETLPISSEPRPAFRIFERRYTLTPTLYKYLEIGISIGVVSCVELALGDN
ncbi:hypothetical protein ACFW04_014621 [Cataglyphis niger]